MKQIRSPSRPLKLMHLVYGLGTGGMEDTIINVCNRLPPEEYSPSICVFESGGGFEGRVDAGRVELIYVRRYFGNDPTFPFRLARQLRSRKVDILQTNQWATLVEGALAAKLARVPIVVHGEHGTIPDSPKRVLAQRWGWRAANQVYAVSTALADRAASIVGFPRERIHVIHNSVDTERFRPAIAPKDELREEFGLPPNGLLVGMVARFVPFKDHAGVLRALAKLQEGGIEAHLALVGTGPLRDELERLADRLGIADRVHFLGVLAPVERLLNALDVFVSNSSHNEGMSLASLEAMACEIPVVSTRVAAAPEVLDEGNAGILIPAQATESLVRALRDLAGQPDLRSSLGRAGRQRAEDRYTVSSMVESYARLYARLAGVQSRGLRGEYQSLRPMAKAE